HHVETGAAPNPPAVAAALQVLAGMARFEGAEHEVAIRVAGHGGAVYLDLGTSDWSAIEITPVGWCHEPRPPVRMLRSRGMLPLPMPTRGGSIEALREILPVGDDEYRLIIGSILGAVR